MIGHMTYQQHLFGVDYEILTDDPIEIKVISQSWVKEIKEKYEELAGKQFYAHPREKLEQYIEYETKNIIRKLLDKSGKDEMTDIYKSCNNAYKKVKKYYKDLMGLMES